MIYMQNFPENNDKNNLFDPPKHSSWITSPDIRPEKGYNPYRNDFSVFQDIYEAAPESFKGSAPLEDETELQFHYRRQAEFNYTKKEAKRKLTNISSFCAMLVMIFVVLGIAIQIPVSFILSTMTEAQYLDLIDILNYALMAVQYFITFPLIFLIGSLGRKNKYYTFFRKPKTSSAFTFRWCIISLGVVYIVSILFEMIFSFLQDLGMNVNDLTYALPTEPLDLALYGFFTVICAPLFEEILFRGIILTHLQKYGCIFASVISGVLFGLVHQNHSQMFFATAIGIIFAIMDIRAGSIFPSLIAHVVVNGYSFLNTLIASQTNYNDLVFGDGSVTALDGPVWALFLMGLMNILVYVAMAAAVVLLIVEIAKFPQTFNLPVGDSMLTAKEKAMAFFSSPVVIITLVLLAAIIFMTSFLPPDAISKFLESFSSSLPTE